jgi:Flp pilus assembly protein TadB
VSAVLGAIAAGAGGAGSVLALGIRVPRRRRLRPLDVLVQWESRRALAAGVPAARAVLLLAVDVAAVVIGAAAGWIVTGFPALALAGAALAGGAVHQLLTRRRAALRRRRQDDVLETVRALRRLLGTGALGVRPALSTLADCGPAEVRPYLAAVVAATNPTAERAAWAAGRAALAEPAFDLLSAAVLVQRPGGGELGPLFEQLEASVAGLHEVERESDALQVQARSAAALILALPLAFLCLMCALRSPYLDPYRSLGGQAFLAAMLLVMAGAHVWIDRWLRLPTTPRLDVADA